MALSPATTGLRRTVDDGEIFFLIASFLQMGPCHRTSRELEAELAELNLLPKKETLQQMRHRCSCPPDQLRRLLARLLELNSEVQRSSSSGADGQGDVSLLTIVGATERVAQRTPAVPRFVHRRELQGRAPALGARSSAELLLGEGRFGLRGIFEGHTSAAYCVVFDPTGERIFTGADDALARTRPASCTGRWMD